MGRIVYAFPATGKTFLCSKNSNYIELSSEQYRWLDVEHSENNKGIYNVPNLAWPNNYLEAIKQAKRKYDFVFITHSGSILCKKNGIHYDLIYPSKDCKMEYLNRMKNRGNNSTFIENMEENYDAYISELDGDDYPDEKIVLKQGEYLEDGIARLITLTKTPLLDRFDSKENLVSVNNSSNEHRNKTRRIIEDSNVRFALINFNSEYVESLIKSGLAREIGRFYSGSDYKKIVLLDNLVITSSFLGGPNASALMEELAYYGIRHYLAVGTACRISNINCDCMVVEKAIRDEGTSLFYDEPALYGYTNKIMNNHIMEILKSMNINTGMGITWTTDAYYRENIERMKKRILQGAMCIDMESSVWCSTARELELAFSQILFFTDICKNGIWIREKRNVDINDSISDVGVSVSKELIKRIGKV